MDTALLYRFSVEDERHHSNLGHLYVNTHVISILLQKRLEYHSKSFKCEWFH